MLTVAIAGAGSRGTVYSRILAELKEQVRITAVADPRPERRNALACICGNPEVRLFERWEEMAACGEKVADAVIIATQDSNHTAPALAFAGAGYHILLEKPMAPTWEECCRIVDAVEKAGIRFAVCHVLRYTPYVQEIKRLLDSKSIGELTGIQHLEPVMYWHQAHSFVRGNWRNSRESSFMLLQKSCHDLDLLSYFAGRPCREVSSFGTLSLFRKENRPREAAGRCIVCPIERQCPYSAVKIYWRDRAEKGNWEWPVDVLTLRRTKEALFECLRNGPYGRCVYDCDNDVVDHQVVNLNFEGGLTADFTMTAFTPNGIRRTTRFFGTEGMIEGNGRELTIFRYLDDSVRTIDTAPAAGTVSDGHGGGDSGLIHAFLRALNGEESALTSTARTTLESHRIVFKAEESRRSGTTLSLS